MTNHMSRIAFVLILGLSATLARVTAARVESEAGSPTIIFSEAGFPAADATVPTVAELRALLAGARAADAAQLPGVLADPATRLLVMPYGSAYPEADWPAIEAFLERGGNLLALGGRPFTRAAYRDAGGWHLRAYSVRDAQQLMIDQYQETPGSDGLTFETNPDLVLKLPAFTWKRAFSPVIHLTASDVYPQEGGSAGRIEARLDALAWGDLNGRRMSAPAIQIDHLRHRFALGRWIFFSAQLPADFYESSEARELVPELAAEARRGAEEFLAEPVLPLYLPGEPVELAVSWQGAGPGDENLSAKITISSEQSPADQSTQTVKIPAEMPVVMPAPASGGFHTVEARLYSGDTLRAIYHSAFWNRDRSYLLSGPRLSVNKDYFELDGHPLAVVGTTYMASDVQRLYFDHPNAYVWNRDMAQIHAAGLNMLRTGWWTGWDKICDEEGRPYERALRTLEAYLMTARKNGLPVQFNFFAFLPQAMGGANAYLDPQAVRRQTTLVSTVVSRFHDVPFVAWDLINEPSFSQHLWKMLPNGDSFELSAWDAWLRGRYPNIASLADDWNVPSLAPGDVLPVPREEEFDPRGMYSGFGSLKLYDFFSFAQEEFARWVKNLRAAIRATGSTQPITVGQDEGGFDDRLSPAFFGKWVDFTTNHSWWDNDSLLWDSLVAKQPGRAMLIQETGLQRELTLQEIARRSQVSDADLLERKIAMSFVEGSGAIQWLWNSNDYMTMGNEVPIGALRADLTEKPEATVLRDFARFAGAAQESLREPQRAEVAVVTSQAAQFSAIRELQVEAQRKAVRAAAYGAHVPVYVIAENEIANLGTPKLVILPSPQALAESTWQALLEYVRGGGSLLVTGPVARDVHWHPVDRTSALKLDAAAAPLTTHSATISVGGETIAMTFDMNAQSWLEAARFANGDTFAATSYGRGKVFWAAYPVELAEDTKASAELYAAVFRRAGIESPYELKSSVAPGVLIYPTVLREAVLYVMESETDRDQELDIRDRATGAELKLHLPAERAALAVIRKSDGAVIARYGF